ncbi:MAG: hypothetical protein ABIT61_03145 [Steroidobacteraceae bacterium]
MSQFLHWCSFSVFGHVVLFEVAIAAPLLLVVAIGLRLSGLYTPANLAIAALALSVGGALIGLATWFTVTRPLIRKE